MWRIGSTRSSICRKNAGTVSMTSKINRGGDGHKINASSKAAAADAADASGRCGLRGDEQDGISSNPVQHQISVEMELHHPCPLCGLKYWRKKDLYRHMRTKHDKIRAQINEILNAKEEIQPYQCIICNKSFKKRQAMYDHRRRYHTKDELDGAKVVIETH